MEQTQAPGTTWTITRAEWDGLGRLSPAMRILLGIAVLMQFAVAVSLCLAPWALARLAPGPFPTGEPRHIATWFSLAAGVLLLLLMQLLLFWYARRRFERLRPMVWDANGCVCPWCRVRVDETPCRRHGLSSAEQATLIRYWEALATQQAKGIFETSKELAQAAGKHRRRWPVVSTIADAFRDSMAVSQDPDRTPMQRMLGSWKWIAWQIAILVAGLALASLLLPRSVVGGVLLGCWPWIVVAPLYAFIGPLWRFGRLRCKACGHYCTSEQQERCLECGATLRAPGAVTRRQRVPWSRFALLALPAIVAFALHFATDFATPLLPASMRSAIWANTRPPWGYWQNLDPTVMTPAQVDEEAQVLIRCAEPGGPRPLFDFDFLPRAEAAGKLSDAMIDAALRATVQASLTVERTDDGPVAIVHPSFGELLFGQQRVARLVFGGARVDDGPWTPSAPWSLFAHDLDEFWRRSGKILPPLPEAKLEFRASLGALSAGTHRVRVRCWIVLTDPSWSRYEPAFDTTGALVAPKGAKVLELPLEALYEQR
ncbi:MAG: hypothetical protein U0625_04665 [Phycisphaerales bacterium]